MQRWEANEPRYRADGKGHYESYFVRGNHPSRAQAFWLRYTIFSPAGRPGDAVGQLWAIVFDGQPVAVKSAVPIADTRFAGSTGGLDIRVGEAVLRDDATGGALRGAIIAVGHTVTWDLTYRGGGAPVLMLADRMYTGGFPKAKVLVPAPLVEFDGRLEVDGEPLDVTGWVGSENHNWGSRHTDEYAWGQVAGFDGAADTFLECSTARVRVGGVPTPWLTPVVVRQGERDLRLNALKTCLRARARYDRRADTLRWSFRTSEGGAEVRGEFSAPRSSFVTLAYDNPPGGVKTCLNTKVARCDLEIRRPGEPPVRLHTDNRAAFEILYG